MSAVGSLADIAAVLRNVRFAPDSGHRGNGWQGNSEAAFEFVDPVTLKPWYPLPLAQHQQAHRCARSSAVSPSESSIRGEAGTLARVRVRTLLPMRAIRGSARWTCQCRYPVFGDGVACSGRLFVPSPCVGCARGSALTVAIHVT
jgi:hypothetical protein